MEPEAGHICGEIVYEYTEGEYHNYVCHSDICGTLKDPKWRAFLHENLDEWLDKTAESKGSMGAFWVGDLEHCMVF